MVAIDENLRSVGAPTNLKADPTTKPDNKRKNTTTENNYLVFNTPDQFSKLPQDKQFTPISSEIERLETKLKLFQPLTEDEYVEYFLLTGNDEAAKLLNKKISGQFLDPEEIVKLDAWMKFPLAKDKEIAELLIKKKLSNNLSEEEEIKLNNALFELEVAQNIRQQERMEEQQFVEERNKKLDEDAKNKTEKLPPPRKILSKEEISERKKAIESIRNPVEKRFETIKLQLEEIDSIEDENIRKTERAKLEKDGSLDFYYQCVANPRFKDLINEVNQLEKEFAEKFTPQIKELQEKLQALKLEKEKAKEEGKLEEWFAKSSVELEKLEEEIMRINLELEKETEKIDKLEKKYKYRTNIEDELITWLNNQVKTLKSTLNKDIESQVRDLHDKSDVINKFKDKYNEIMAPILELEEKVIAKQKAGIEKLDDEVRDLRKKINELCADENMQKVEAKLTKLQEEIENSDTFKRLKSKQSSVSSYMPLTKVEQDILEQYKKISALLNDVKNYKNNSSGMKGDLLAATESEEERTARLEEYKKNHSYSPPREPTEAEKVVAGVLGGIGKHIIMPIIENPVVTGIVIAIPVTLVAIGAAKAAAVVIGGYALISAVGAIFHAVDGIKEAKKGNTQEATEHFTATTFYGWFSTKGLKHAWNKLFGIEEASPSIVQTLPPKTKQKPIPPTQEKNTVESKSLEEYIPSIFKRMIQKNPEGIPPVNEGPPKDIPYLNPKNPEPMDPFKLRKLFSVLKKKMDKMKGDRPPKSQNNSGVEPAKEEVQNFLEKLKAMGPPKEPPKNPNITDDLVNKAIKDIFGIELPPAKPNRPTGPPPPLNKVKFLDEDATKAFIAEQIQKYPSIKDLWSNLQNPIFGKVKAFKVGDETCHIIWLRTKLPMTEFKSIEPGSVLAKYLASKPGSKEHAIFQECEGLLMNAFAEAKSKFPNGIKTPSGFVIEGSTDFGMESGYIALGIRVNGKVHVESLLKALESGNERKVQQILESIKAEFSHEITHRIRINNDLESPYAIFSRDIKDEIAEHVIQFLHSPSRNLRFVRQLHDSIRKPNKGFYNQAQVASLKVLFKKLSDNTACKYKPKDYTPHEISKAIESISESEREAVIQKITEEILFESGDSLKNTANSIPDIEIPER